MSKEINGRRVDLVDDTDGNRRVVLSHQTCNINCCVTTVKNIKRSVLGDILCIRVEGLHDCMEWESDTICYNIARPN